MQFHRDTLRTDIRACGRGHVICDFRKVRRGPQDVREHEPEHEEDNNTKEL